MNFLKKIFSPTILTISLLLLIYTFYKSEIIWDGNNRNYYKTYYLISSILICLSIITFFLNDIINKLFADDSFLQSKGQTMIMFLPYIDNLSPFLNNSTLFLIQRKSL